MSLVPGVDVSGLTGAAAGYDLCFDPLLPLAFDLTAAGPCLNPEADGVPDTMKWNMKWRNTAKFCTDHKNGAMDYGSVRLRRETKSNIASDSEDFIVFAAGVMKVAGDNSYSVCGCKQSRFSMKRKTSMKCPATATQRNGVNAGPDILGQYWCPVQQPYSTMSIISGCFHATGKAAFKDEDFLVKCDKSPHVVPLFG